MKYSKLTGGFYDAAINADIPADAVDVFPADYAALFVAQSNGKQIQADANGYPIAVDPLPVAPVVPASVSPAQARLALLAAGLLDDVETAVAAGPRAMQIAWQNASVIERDSPTVAALAGALGLNDAQLDALFTTAAGIFV
jgi:hypothetical protein